MEIELTKMGWNPACPFKGCNTVISSEHKIEKDLGRVNFEEELREALLTKANSMLPSINNLIKSLF
jgi:hypothetical protein